MNFDYDLRFEKEISGMIEVEVKYKGSASGNMVFGYGEEITVKTLGILAHFAEANPKPVANLLHRKFVYTILPDSENGHHVSVSIVKQLANELLSKKFAPQKEHLAANLLKIGVNLDEEINKERQKDFKQKLQRSEKYIKELQEKNPGPQYPQWMLSVLENEMKEVNRLKRLITIEGPIQLDEAEMLLEVKQIKFTNV